MFNKLLNSFQLDIKTFIRYKYKLDILLFYIKKYLSFIYNQGYVNIFGGKYYFNKPNDIGFLHELIAENLYISKYVGGTGLILDIGANNGQFFFMMRYVLKCSNDIISYEPLQAPFKILQKHNKHSFNIAISTSPNVVLSYNHTTMVASIFKDTNDIYSENVVGKQLTWNNVKGHHTYIELIKIDTEGSEFDVLQALDSDIFSHTKFFLIECSNIGRGNSGDIHVVINFLYEKGFIITYLNNFAYKNNIPYIGDILFINKSYL